METCRQTRGENMTWALFKAIREYVGNMQCYFKAANPNLRDSFPAVKDFYQLKKEFMMERNEWEIMAAKLNDKMKTFYNKGSHTLPKVAVGDKVWNQNQKDVGSKRVKSKFWCSNRCVRLSWNIKYSIKKMGKFQFLNNFSLKKVLCRSVFWWKMGPF